MSAMATSGPFGVGPTLVIADGAFTRPLTVSDAAELFSVVDANRPRLRQWLPWLDANRSVADTRAFIDASRRDLEQGRALRLGVWAGGPIAGVISMEKVDWANRNAEIGYWLDRLHEGKGLMTAAVATLCDYGFRTLGLVRIQIAAAVDNARSRRVPERLGFAQEGVLRSHEWLYDHFVDHALYAMLAAEWPGKQVAEHRARGLTR